MTLIERAVVVLLAGAVLSLAPGADARGQAPLLDDPAAELAGTLGAGETVNAVWRWEAARPRVAMVARAPARWLPGIVSLDVPELASREAILALWPGAGTGKGRGGLLRAHPLGRGGIMTGLVFGLGVGHFSLEYVRPVARVRGRGFSVAGFVDAGRAWHRVSPDSSPLYIDAGVGMRLPAPGHDQTIRIDLAHGLRGGGATISASWGGAW